MLPLKALKAARNEARSMSSLRRLFNFYMTHTKPAGAPAADDEYALGDGVKVGLGRCVMPCTRTRLHIPYHGVL